MTDADLSNTSPDADQNEPLCCEVTAETSSMRLDRALAILFPQFSRSRLKTWVKNGQVTVQGEQRRPRDPVFQGESIVVAPTPEAVHELAPQAMPLAVLYQDDDVLVVNKPAGLVVHPGAGNPDGTLVNGLLHYDAGLSEVPRAGLIHRLDKDTSGLLMVARTLEAHTALSAAMQRRDISRSYFALCVGRLSAGGTIDEPIGRHTGDRTKMTVKTGGRHAVTHYRVMERYRGNSLVSVQLETGRTHQIRVHFAHLSHPLVGDVTYGRPSFPRGAGAQLNDQLSTFKRQALHAHSLTFAHPRSNESVSVSVRPPQDFRSLCQALRDDAATMGPDSY